MILVSGASGLVGRYLLAELVPFQPKIRALFHREKSRDGAIGFLSERFEPEKLNCIEWRKTDLTDLPDLSDCFAQITEVYHCAGYISGDENEAKKMRKINIEGTANMVNLALSRKLEKFCHVSSIAALGNELDRKPIHENSPRNNEKGRSSYALSKYGGEMEAWRASEEGLPVVIVNPGVILGQGDWNSGSGQLFSQIGNGLNYHLPIVSGYVGARDVARAMHQLMEKKCFEKRYILVSENRSLKSVLVKIAEVLGKRPPKKEIKPWMVVVGWIFQTVASILWNGKKQLTRNSVSGLFEADYYSSERIKEELGFQFEPIDEVIEATAKEYQKQEMV